MENVRYAVIIYRIPNGSTYYENFGLTVESFDESDAKNGKPLGNRSAYVKVNSADSQNWQYAIIDLMGLNTADGIAKGTKIQTVYLQSPLHWEDNGGNPSGSYWANPGEKCMDIAAVGYFPYYGDAEQFAYYGLTLGSKQQYFNANNAGFSFRNNSNTHLSLSGTRTQVCVKSLPTFYKENEYVGAKPTTISTYDPNYSNLDVSAMLDTDGYLDLSTTAVVTELEKTGINLYGAFKGEAVFGLVEPTLGEDGRPVYRKSVMAYLAAYLRHQLLTIPEYPSDNYGWRNYSFITGVSTADGTNQKLFGTNEYGQSIDLATAICTQLGLKKGGAIKSEQGSFGTLSNAYYDYSLTGYADAKFGSYEQTMAHKDELIGSWNDCKGNIRTWCDASYFLLQNLFVAEDEIATNKVDGYGDYETQYQSIIMPEVSYKGDNAYFFDSGYAYYTDINDASTYSSALLLDKNNHTITLKGDAQGTAQFHEDGAYTGLWSSYFPFLITSGNGTAAGETNSPYYCHAGVLSRDKDSIIQNGTTYWNRDYHYSMAGSGYFAYEKGQYFHFIGDDDVFVFINGQLVVDLGGTHGAASFEMHLDDYVNWAKGVKYEGKTYNGKLYNKLNATEKARVDALCLEEDAFYSFDFFYMERHGVGSNLRIMTNMQIVSGGLDVDKLAYQGGNEVVDNGIADVDAMLEYAFTLTNNSTGKLYDLNFRDEVIGISMDITKGLTPGKATDASGGTLDPSDLVITVDGYDSSGNRLATVNVTCADNTALINFLKTLNAAGTQSGNAATDFTNHYSGSGLWRDATVTVRGIYYKLTDAQKKTASFTNTVTGSGLAKIASEDATHNGIENVTLFGMAKHTIYQPGTGYYQWVGKPIVVESERLYNDLLANKIVASPADLPKPGQMILIPSDSEGKEVDNTYVSNVPGGDVYLKINYDTPGSHMAYVTIRSKVDAGWSMTVPLTINAVETKDSMVVLDYGMDAHLSTGEELFEHELNSFVGNATGTVLGFAADTITPSPSYKNYDENSILTSVGQIANKMNLVYGAYNGNGAHNGAIYELETPINLDHNKPWVIEWKASHGAASLMLAEAKTISAGDRYIYVQSSAGSVYMGENGTGGDLATTFTGYNNYGASSTNFTANTMHEFKLVNVPDGADGNKIYLYVDDDKAGAMGDVYRQNAIVKTATNKWISGKDFTFTHFGTTAHASYDTYEYLRVYEDGYQFTHYNWVKSGDQMVPGTDTGELGYTQITTTKATNNSKTYWEFGDGAGVTLAHDESWKISFTAKLAAGTLVMTGGFENSDATNTTHIYMAENGNGEAMVFMGYRNPSSIGSHTNFGVDVKKVISSFNFADSHNYVLENRISPDGTNMVHLTVDGTYIGALDTRYHGGSTNQGTSTEISGLDFAFHRFGANNGSHDYVSGSEITSMEIRTKTGLKNVYEWVAGGDGLVSVVATDNTGNQIDFTREADGRITLGDGRFLQTGNGLEFKVLNMLDAGYGAVR